MAAHHFLAFSLPTTEQLPREAEKQSNSVPGGGVKTLDGVASPRQGISSKARWQVEIWSHIHPNSASFVPGCNLIPTFTAALLSGGEGVGFIS